MQINPEEILDLIAEVGQTILLCDIEQAQGPDVFYGMPTQNKVSTRQVRGYVVPEKVSLLHVLNTELKAGAYIAYISAKDMDRSTLTERSRLSFEGTLYPIEYLEGVFHCGVILLHKLRMLRPQHSIQQPSQVLR